MSIRPLSSSFSRKLASPNAYDAILKALRDPATTDGKAAAALAACDPARAERDLLAWVDVWRKEWEKREPELKAFRRDIEKLEKSAEGNAEAWFAIRMGPSTFAIFDAFPDEAGRQAHLAGRVAAALMKNAPDLLASSPSIDKADVLAAKLPH